MDQICSDSIHTLYNCKLHPQNKPTFIQINEISNESNSNIFQCVTCFEQDLQFRGANYMLIQPIFENQVSHFNYKWPPLNKYQIIQQIHLFANNINSTQTILNQINSQYKQLKVEILKKIKITQQKAMDQVLKLPFSQKKIMQRYIEISQIKNLRQILTQDQNKPFDLYHQQCKNFLQQVELQKDRNTQLFQELLNECQKVQKLVNFERLNQSKQSILDLLDKINEFDDKIESQVSSSSVQFQQQTNSQLDRLIQQSFLFEKISSQQTNQQKSDAIRLSELSDENIKKVNEYVEHLINMQNDPQYVQSIKNSPQIQKLQSVFNNKFNFISKKYQDNLMNYLIETYPFLKNIFTDQIHSEEQSFQIVTSLDSNYINNFLKLAKKKQNIDENQINFENTQSQKVQKGIKLNFEQNELNNVLKMFPIFDLIELKPQISILNELQFQKSNYCDGNQRIKIVKNKNKQFEFLMDEYTYRGEHIRSATNCISQALEKEKKYIFRIQFKKGNGGLFWIGLMQNENLNIHSGYNDKMSHCFYFQNYKMQCLGGYGIEKIVKGYDQQLLDEKTTLELRVWLQGLQLEVLDYPSYSYHVQIKNEYKQNLLQNDLCLNFCLIHNQDKCILLEALTVEQF